MTLISSQHFRFVIMVEEEQVKKEDSTKELSDSELDKLKAERKNRRKKRLMKEAAKADKRGVCYLSRVPPRMDPLKLRHILSQYGDIERIWLTPEDPAAPVHRKKAGGFRGQGFTEGWVEFTNKNVAKRVASTLNGEQIGGKKKSSFYYDLWNIKYLSKFKWDHLTEEIAYKNATREQKLALELSAAKKERDFYLAKVDQSRALSSIDERLKKKRKIQQANGTSEVQGDHQQAAKVIRQFPQTKSVRDGGEKQKPGLSKDLLAGVFGGSS
ncbi:putative RNA recognition motif domain, nucleotide-binding alpha-beta plait domain superfamily [Helianthus debilis subsp. tardiflorus]